MKIEKLPSGSYRIRKMYKGETYAVTFDYKPTQKEAMQAMAEELDKVQEKRLGMTFESAANEYIESRKSVISPSTVRGYCGIIRQVPRSFLNMNVHDITAMDVQKEINSFSKDHSPKSVRNYHGFISAVLGAFCPNLKLATTLPQNAKMSLIYQLARILKRYLTTQKVRNLKFLSF